MAANLLNSDRAVQMSIFVVRAFIKMRETLGTSEELRDKLTALEKQLSGRLDMHEKAILQMLAEIRKLIQPSPLPEHRRKPIGFGKQDEV